MDFPQLIAVVLEEVIHRLDTNADGGQWAVLIQITKGEVRLARLLDNLLNDPTDESVVTALEVG